MTALLERHAPKLLVAVGTCHHGTTELALALCKRQLSPFGVLLHCGSSGNVHDPVVAARVDCLHVERALTKGSACLFCCQFLSS